MVRVHFSPPAFPERKANPHLENCTGKQEKNNQFRERLNGLRRVFAEQARSSEQERRVDAMALIADEGRDKLR